LINSDGWLLALNSTFKTIYIVIIYRTHLYFWRSL